jgi:phospholipase C
MENRSFDHYLGSLSLVEKRGFDGLTGSEWNPDPSGKKVYVQPLATLTPADPPHDWASAHHQWNNGSNDGFIAAHAGADQNDVMGYYTRQQLPTTYALADGSAICERWFSSLLGPTWPNRMFLHGASSNGVKTNAPALGLRSIFDVLDAAPQSNKNYYSDLAWAAGGYGKLNNLAPVESYFQDAAAGKLPAFSLVEPDFDRQSEENPQDISVGEAFSARVVNAVMQSPNWKNTVLLFCYDEHGGYYDHVPPPPAPAPDEKGPDLEAGDVAGAYDRLGFRVPAVVVAPFAKKDYVSHVVRDHTSILSVIEHKFNLPALTNRDGAADNLLETLDLANTPSFLTPPRLSAPQNPTEAQVCTPGEPGPIPNPVG